ncbi:hypothetical protein [Rhodanobacter sp. C05]|uniref:hypothetical protein n=1 Tax=Rhodanobacter sp. C05 TaxID=1945855 RepID=UPI00117A1FD4|nr:hypothetical protein [Rhodanobacter sp. C05]
MKINGYFISVIIAISAFMVMSAGYARSDTLDISIAAKYQAFYKVENSPLNGRENDRPKLTSAAYERIMSPLQKNEYLNAYTPEELDLLFRAAYGAVFYTLDSKYVADMRIDLAELHKRGVALDRHYEYLYRSLIMVRNFDAANSVADEYHFSREDLPHFDLAGYYGDGPSELTLSPDGKEMMRRKIVLPPGPQIIVIGHPLCHFSQNASKFIEDDIQLRDAFLKHSKWLMPQDGLLNPDVVGKWNTEHPVSTMTYIFRQSEWPIIDAWSTPNFYFFYDGQLVGRLTGWPPSGGVGELTVELRKIGLIH